MMGSVTVYFQDIKAVARLELLRLINRNDISQKTKMQIKSELDRRMGGSDG